MGDGLASTAGNWVGGEAPAAGDSLLFKLDKPQPCTIDAMAPATLAGLILPAGYAGGIIIARNLTITTNLAAFGGTVKVLKDIKLSVQTLNLAGGATITGPGNLEVVGAMEISRGALEGLQLSASGALTLSNASLLRVQASFHAGSKVTITDGLSLDATVIESGGVVKWRSGSAPEVGRAEKGKSERQGAHWTAPVEAGMPGQHRGSRKAIRWGGSWSLRRSISRRGIIDAGNGRLSAMLRVFNLTWFPFASTESILVADSIR